MRRARAGVSRCLIAWAAAAALAAAGCASMAKVPLDLGPIHRNAIDREVAPATDTLRVVAYNIEFNRQMELALEELLTHPDLRGADVLLLQEVDLHGTRWLAAALGMSYVYDAVSYHPKSKGGFWGNAVLSPHRIDAPWREELPGHRSVTDRRMVGCTVRHPRGDVLVASLHAETSIMNLAPWGGGQADQWRFAARAAKDHARDLDRLVVGGDFNSAPILPLLFPTVGKLLEIFRDAGYTELTAGDQPTGAGHGYQLDHIFGIGLETQRSGVATDTRASDHHPVWAVTTFAN